MTHAQDRRQETRRNGRYAKMTPCPRCGKRRALEPAYSVRDGGVVGNDSPWGGGFLCNPCLKKEAVLDENRNVRRPEKEQP